MLRLRSLVRPQRCRSCRQQARVHASAFQQQLGFVGRGSVAGSRSLSTGQDAESAAESKQTKPPAARPRPQNPLSRFLSAAPGEKLVEEEALPSGEHA